MRFLDYYPCHNAEKVASDSNYNKDGDKENSADSIFCAKGAGFLVRWGCPKVTTTRKAVTIE